MTHPPLDDPSHVGALPRPSRGVACWVALLALLVNVLLPTVVSVGIRLLDPNRGTLSSSLCSTTADPDLPGKGKPWLHVRHCALCAVPAALPPRRQAGVANECAIADAAYLRVRPPLAAIPFRLGPAQARAPPIVS